MIYYVALLRGINVGKAKRISMEDLGAVIERLGYESVRTILNTGNIVFRGKKAAEQTIADRIREMLDLRHGLDAAVVVITATDLDSILRENALGRIATDPAKYHVGFAMDQTALFAARALAGDDFGDEALAVTPRAAYLWTPKGVAASSMVKAVDRASRQTITMRNWSTLLKIQAATRVRD